MTSRKNVPARPTPVYIYWNFTPFPTWTGRHDPINYPPGIGPGSLGGNYPSIGPPSPPSTRCPPGVGNTTNTSVFDTLGGAGTGAERTNNRYRLSNRKGNWNPKIFKTGAKSVRYQNTFSLASTGTRVVRGNTAVAATIGSVDIYSSYVNEGSFGPETQVTAGGVGGGILGGGGGAAAGGFVGSFFGGIGAIPGSVIGGAIFGGLGGYGGSELGKDMVRAAQAGDCRR